MNDEKDKLLHTAIMLGALLPFQVKSFSTQRKKYSNMFSAFKQLVRMTKQ